MTRPPNPFKVDYEPLPPRPPIAQLLGGWRRIWFASGLSLLCLGLGAAIDGGPNSDLAVLGAWLMGLGGLAVGFTYPLADKDSDAR